MKFDGSLKIRDSKIVIREKKDRSWILDAASW